MPEAKDFADRVIENVGRVIVGKRQAVELVLEYLLMDLLFCQIMVP